MICNFPSWGYFTRLLICHCHLVSRSPNAILQLLLVLVWILWLILYLSALELDTITARLTPSYFRTTNDFKFFRSRHSGLHAILNSPNTVLVYPTSDAADLNELPKVDESSPFRYNLVLIDGTWPQAKTIYNKSKALHSLKQVEYQTTFLVSDDRRDYFISTRAPWKCWAASWDTWRLIRWRISVSALVIYFCSKMLNYC